MMQEYTIKGNTFYLLYGQILQPQLVRPMDLECSDLRDAMKKSGALMARWISAFTTYPSGLWYIVQDRFYPLESYKSRVRTYIRSGSRQFSFYRSQDLDEIVDVVSQVDGRLGYNRRLDRQKIARHAGSLTPNYQWWLLRDKSGEAAGYVLLYLSESQLHVRTIHLLPEAKRKGAAYFVNYRLSEIFIKDQGAGMIVYGLRSLEHRTNVQQWLEDKMFYKRLYVKMEVCLDLRGRLVYALARPWLKILEMIPISFIRKLAAFVRFISLAYETKKE